MRKTGGRLEITFKAASKDLACKWLMPNGSDSEVSDMFISDSVSGTIMAGVGPQNQRRSAARVRPPSTFTRTVVRESGSAGRVAPNRWRGEGVTSTHTVKALQGESRTITSSQWHLWTPFTDFKSYQSCKNAVI